MPLHGPTANLSLIKSMVRSCCMPRSFPESSQTGKGGGGGGGGGLHQQRTKQVEDAVDQKDADLLLKGVP